MSSEDSLSISNYGVVAWLSLCQLSTQVRLVPVVVTYRKITEKLKRTLSVSSAVTPTMLILLVQ